MDRGVQQYCMGELNFMTVMYINKGSSVFMELFEHSLQNNSEVGWFSLATELE